LSKRLEVTFDICRGERGGITASFVPSPLASTVGDDAAVPRATLKLK
jgi:hypothetical protein